MINKWNDIFSFISIRSHPFLFNFSSQIWLFTYTELDYSFSFCFIFHLLLPFFAFLPNSLCHMLPTSCTSFIVLFFFFFFPSATTFSSRYFSWSLSGWLVFTCATPININLVILFVLEFIVKTYKQIIISLVA